MIDGFVLAAAILEDSSARAASAIASEDARAVAARVEGLELGGPAQRTESLKAIASRLRPQE